MKLSNKKTVVSLVLTVFLFAIVLLSVKRSVAYADYTHVADTFTKLSAPQSNWTGSAISSTGQYQSATSNGGGSGGYFYQSSDYGSTWTPSILGLANWWKSGMSGTGQYQLVGQSPGYVYLSSDYGTTWSTTTLSSAPSWQFVDMSKDGQYQITCATNGDADGGVYTSKDYGVTWTRVSNIAYPRQWHACAISDNGQYQLASRRGGDGFTDPHIYISSDYGDTFSSPPATASYDALGAGYHDGAISGNGQYFLLTSLSNFAIRSSDYGVTWEEVPYLESGISNHGIQISADGKIQVSVSEGTPGMMNVSYDYGKTWASSTNSQSYNWWKGSMTRDGSRYLGITVNGYAYESISDTSSAPLNAQINPEQNVDTTPPTIKGGSPTGVLPTNTNSITMSVTTDENSTCKYSTTPNTAFGSSTNTFSTTGNLNHTTVVHNLSANTTYTYYVRCSDSSSNSDQTDYNVSFSVAPPTNTNQNQNTSTTTVTDTTPPSIYAIGVSSITTTSAIVYWNTNEGADGQINFGTDVSYGRSTSINGALVTSHTQSLTNLLPNTLYHFIILSRDASGNLGHSSDTIFTTLASPTEIQNNQLIPTSTPKQNTKTILVNPTYHPTQDQTNVV